MAISMQKESRYELIPSRNIGYQIIVQSDWLKAYQAINEKSDLSQASSRAHCYASFLFFYHIIRFYFWQKAKSSVLKKAVFFLLKISIFWKIWYRKFLNLNVLWFLVKFQKFLQTVCLRKTDEWRSELLTNWHTVMLTYCPINRCSFGEPFLPKGGM